MTTDPITLDDVQRLALRLATTLDEQGSARAATVLRLAAATQGSDHERLLEMRSALVVTRNDWESAVNSALRADALRTLRAAKRLAIEM